MLPRVQGKPFEADCEWVYVKKLPDGQTATRTTSGMVARDSSGRRLDQHEVLQQGGADEHPVWQAHIYDPISQTLNYVDLGSGTTFASLPVAAGLDDRGAEVPTLEIQGISAPLTLDVPESADGTLGRKMIEGMDCTGYFRKVPGWEIEYWVADELEQTIRYRITTEDFEATIRVTNLLQSEPDPELFVVPPADQRPHILDDYIVRKSDWLDSPKTS